MIKKLDELTIRQIAAGEVIEGPASVVKELVENSIDAGSTKIDVALIKAGKEEIRVTDNGNGIPAGEINAALERHATSKISNSQDLHSLSTLGFRGEALPSIAAVSSLTLETKRADEITGTRAVFAAGEMMEKKETGLPQGTMVEVKNLFYNVPARKKFMRQDSSEMQKIISLMQKFCFSYPQISFSLTSGKRLLFQTKGNSTLENVIKKIFGQQYFEEMMTVYHRQNEFSLSGFIGKPGLCRPHRKDQYFFVNKRIISSDLIRKALEAGYGSLLMSKHYPVAILNIEVPPGQIDVNIHPSKMEVRFNNEKEIFDPLVKTIQSTLQTPGSTPTLRSSPIKYQSDNMFFPVSDQAVNINETAKENMQTYELYENSPTKKVIKDTCKETGENVNNHKEIVEPKMPSVYITGQFLYSYITGIMEEQFIFIDQHAAHERVLFEQFQYTRNEEGTSDFFAQQLAFPIAIELRPYMAEKIIDNKSLFTETGFKIEQFGDNTLIFRAVPTFLQEICTDALLISIMEEISEKELTSMDLLRHKITVLAACKKAIKARQKLHMEEMIRLIDNLRRTSNPYSCPHGRPTLLRVTKSNLDSFFKRSGGHPWHG